MHRGFHFKSLSFQRKVQAKMQSSTAQVKELTSQMTQMRLRQQELEARNGVLEYTCTLASKHIMELNEDPVRCFQTTSVLLISWHSAFPDFFILAGS